MAERPAKLFLAWVQKQIDDLPPGAQLPVAQALITLFSAKNEGYKWMASH